METPSSLIKKWQNTLNKFMWANRKFRIIFPTLYHQLCQGGLNFPDLRLYHGLCPYFQCGENVAYLRYYKLG